jgi:trehalose 6-phosphate phosphatase
MRHILARRNLPALETFAHSKVVVAFDYDGTLAPIRRDPARARLRPVTERLLGAVAQSYPCIVISGRGRTELEPLIGRIGFRQVIGNHGLEPSWGRPAYARRVHEWARQLQRRLPEQRGLVIEAKRYSLAIHYRDVARKREAVAAIKLAIGALRGVRNLGGIQAFNLVPAGAPHKGLALERAMSRFGCDRAIFVGDEATDEDAFRSGSSDRLLSIRVGVRRASAARYYIKAQSEIDLLLRKLLERRPGSSEADRSGASRPERLVKSTAR